MALLSTILLPINNRFNAKSEKPESVSRQEALPTSPRPGVELLSLALRAPVLEQEILAVYGVFDLDASRFMYVGSLGKENLAEGQEGRKERDVVQAEEQPLWVCLRTLPFRPCPTIPMQSSIRLLYEI